MLLFIKKWNFILLCLIVLVGSFCLGLLVRGGGAAKTNAEPEGVKRVIVDAGHGAPDGGAVSPKGLLEKDLNLAIAGFLREELEKNGLSVLMTRSDDNGIYDAESQTIRQKKRSDLANRKKIIEDSGADLFVSVHMNLFSDAKYSGPQVFYSVNHPSSSVLAGVLQAEMNAALKPEKPRAVKPAGKEIYLLNAATLPAVLVECGFLSNAREEALLADETYQKSVAEAICRGVMKHISSE